MKFKIFYNDNGISSSIELYGNTIPRVGDVVDLYGDKNFYDIQTVVLKYDENYSEYDFEVFAKKRSKETKSDFIG